MQFDDQGIEGPDASFYQGDPKRGQYIDFQKMKNYGVDFIILRAGQRNYIDSAFTYNWQAAKEVGIPRSAYWFLDQNVEGKAQATFFWDLLKNDPGEGPLIVDFEAGSGSWPRLADFLVQLGNLSNYPNHLLWIYTGYYYWIEFGPKIQASQDWFKKYPMWLAAYTDNPAYVKAPTGFEIPLWQKGTTVVWGPDLGVHSLELDWNIFNGGWDKFRYYFRVVDTNPNDPPTGGNMQYRVTWSQGVARRTAPTTSNSYTGQSYPVGTVVDVIEDNLPDANDPTNPGKKWVKFADGLYGASIYPTSTGVPQTRMEKVVVSNPTSKAYSIKITGYKEATGILEPE